MIRDKRTSMCDHTLKSYHLVKLYPSVSHFIIYREHYIGSFLTPRLKFELCDLKKWLEVNETEKEDTDIIDVMTFSETKRDLIVKIMKQRQAEQCKLSFSFTQYEQSYAPQELTY